MVLPIKQRERYIRQTLRQLARQRVLDILQPGNIWLVENAVGAHDPEIAAALRTCHLRGWVEVVDAAVPHAAITKDGKLPMSGASAPIYRVTEAGWAAINRTHAWVLATFAVALGSLIAAVLAVLLAVVVP